MVCCIFLRFNEMSVIWAQTYWSHFEGKKRLPVFFVCCLVDQLWDLGVAIKITYGRKTYQWHNTGLYVWAYLCVCLSAQYHLITHTHREREREREHTNSAYTHTHTNQPPACRSYNTVVCLLSVTSIKWMPRRQYPLNTNNWPFTANYR